MSDDIVPARLISKDETVMDDITTIITIVRIRKTDVDALDEAVSRSDGAFSSTSEQSNKEQDAKTKRLEKIVRMLKRGDAVQMEFES